MQLATAPSLVLAATLNVGAFYRMTSSDGTDLGDYWRGVAAGGLLAVKHFNTRNLSIINELGYLSACDVFLNAAYFVTGSFE